MGIARAARTTKAVRSAAPADGRTVIESAVWSGSRSRPAARNRRHMFGKIGLPELLIILTILVLIFGANRLPELGRSIGRGIRSFKDATREGAKEDRA